MRQQVHAEAAADLEVHRQLMRPSVAAATADTAATTAGARWGGEKGCGGGINGGSDDDMSELMETVAALRLKSALEELEARSAHPDVKDLLLKDLLVKVVIPSCLHVIARCFFDPLIFLQYSPEPLHEII